MGPGSQLEGGLRMKWEKKGPKKNQREAHSGWGGAAGGLVPKKSPKIPKKPTTARPAGGRGPAGGPEIGHCPGAGGPIPGFSGKNRGCHLMRAWGPIMWALPASRSTKVPYFYRQASRSTVCWSFFNSLTFHRTWVKA